MSKQAEEKALKYENSLDYYHFTNDCPNIAFKAGYEQAEKDSKTDIYFWAIVAFVAGLVIGVFATFFALQ